MKRIFEKHEHDYEEEYDFLMQDPLSREIARAVRSMGTTPQIIIPHRYQEVVEAKELLRKMLDDCWQDVEIEEKFYPSFHMVGLTVEVEAFEACKMPVFLRFLEKCSTFEVYPLTNGNLRIGVTFKNVTGDLGEEESA